MAVAQRTLPDLNRLDADALRTLILQQQEELLSRDTEIENLRLLILKLKRMQCEVSVRLHEMRQT